MLRPEPLDPDESLALQLAEHAVERLPSHPQLNRELGLREAELDATVGSGVRQQQLRQAGGKIEEDEIPHQIVELSDDPREVLRQLQQRVRVLDQGPADRLGREHQHLHIVLRDRIASPRRAVDQIDVPGRLTLDGHVQHQLAALARSDSGLDVTRADDEQRVAGIATAKEHLLGPIGAGARERGELAQVGSGNAENSGQAAREASRGSSGETGSP